MNINNNCCWKYSQNLFKKEPTLQELILDNLIILLDKLRNKIPMNWLT